jgi:hypothetical protein
MTASPISSTLADVENANETEGEFGSRLETASHEALLSVGLPGYQAALNKLNHSLRDHFILGPKQACLTLAGDVTRSPALFRQAQKVVFDARLPYVIFVVSDTTYSCKPGRTEDPGAVPAGLPSSQRTACSITSETQAKSPLPTTRRRLGVGERVTLKLQSGLATWTVEGGGKIPLGSPINQAQVIFEAPGVASNPIITATVSDGSGSCRVSFAVVEPQEVRFTVFAGPLHDQGTRDIGFLANKFIYPDYVSFRNVLFIEKHAFATASGAFMDLNNGDHLQDPKLKAMIAEWGKQFSAPDPGEGEVIPGLGTRIGGTRAGQRSLDCVFAAATKNDDPDCGKFTGAFDRSTLQLPEAPAGVGEADTEIPWCYKLRSELTSGLDIKEMLDLSCKPDHGWRQFTIVSQKFSKSADGVLTAEKAGAKVRTNVSCSTTTPISQDSNGSFNYNYRTEPPPGQCLRAVQ